jgi:ketosteroid isomerase-like protein
MTKREVVLEFLRCFCTGDIDALEPLLAEDLQFSGPYHHFGSRYAYVQSLKADPPEKCDHRVLSLAESGDDVCVFYDYEKSDQSITVAQLCRFKGRKIGEILLVFDARGAI